VLLVLLVVPSLRIPGHRWWDQERVSNMRVVML
jgi:hypothetical protein